MGKARFDHTGKTDKHYYFGDEEPVSIEEARKRLWIGIGFGLLLSIPIWAGIIYGLMVALG